MNGVRWKIGALIAIILTTLGWLAFTGIRDSKSYFVTVSELARMPDAQTERLRVSGDVVPGTIKTRPGATDFAITEGGRVLEVTYTGTDPLPDTLVDHAQAVANGRLTADGRFIADGVQAKCASKYEPANMRQSGAPMRMSAGKN